MRGIFAVILTIVVATECTNDVFVSNVRQNYNKEVNALLVEQITLELQASYIYNGYATYFQRADVNLPGLQSFFAKASLEERTHANMIMEYVNKRGGHVKLNQISMDTACSTVAAAVSEVHKRDSDGIVNKFCICEFLSNNDISSCISQRDSSWKEGLMAMEDSLAMERYVNSQLLAIHAAAEKHNDAHLSHFLEHELLDEQINSIYEFGGHVTRLRQFGDNYKLGEYLFDQNLK